MSYAFYERNEKQVNFGDLTGNLISAVSGIEEKRQKKRDELDKTYKDFKGVVDGWENVKTQSLNELVHRANDDVRNQMYDAYQELKAGNLSETEWKSIMNNAETTWNAMSASAKAYDKTIQEMLSRQQPGENGEPPEGGAMEQAWLDWYSDLGDLSNKRYIMGRDGNIVLATIGEDGKPVSIASANAINKMGVIKANRVDLNKTAQKYTEGVENWLLTHTKEDGTSYTIEDARKNPEFDKYMTDVVNAIAGDHNPLAQVSVLTDNGGDYRTYRTDEEKRQILDEMTEREAQAVFNSTGKSMTDEEKAKYRADYEGKLIAIKMQKDGQLMPILTDSQKKDSKDIARAAVEMRLGRKETTDAEKTYHRPPASRGGGGSGSKKSDNVAINSYISSVDAIEQGDFNGFDTDKYSFEHKTDKSGKKYVEVTNLSAEEEIQYDSEGKPITITVAGKSTALKKRRSVKVYSPDGMTQYLKGVSGSVHLYHEGKDDYKKMHGDYYYKPKGGSSSSSSTKPKFN